MNRDNIQTRSSEFTNSGRVVEGYAIVFNSWSEVLYGEFRELILPTAIDMSTVNASDIFATLDHDRRRPLARRRNGSGTLDISIDDQGLKYRFELADTQVQNEVFEYITRGELNQSSFQFQDDEDEWNQGSDGIMERTVKHINQLFDVSQVFCPAYTASTVTISRCNSAKDEIKNRELERVKKELQDRELALDKYHKKLERRILSL